MKTLYATSFAVLVLLGFAIVRGDRADVRYRDSACNYYLTYENDGPITIAGFGGSRMLTAFDADDLAQVLKDSGHPDAVVYNSAHSHYSIEKEYILVRDMLESRPVKTIVVMLQPRKMDPLPVSRDFKSIARLQDLPVLISASSHENPMNGITTSAELLIERLKFPEPVRSCETRKARGALCKRAVKRKEPTRNCHSGDYRPDLEGLLRGEKRAKANSKRSLQWDPASPANDYSRHFIEKITTLAQSKGTAVFFLFLYRTSQPPLADGIEDKFRAATGAELLIPPREMVRQLAKDGRRDVSHMNAKGRALFLPWLVAEIKSRCPRSDGCL